ETAAPHARPAARQVTPGENGGNSFSHRAPIHFSTVTPKPPTACGRSPAVPVNPAGSTTGPYGMRIALFIYAPWGTLRRTRAALQLEEIE
ncbi:MAG: hypothetical protein Q7U75_14685, partial [Desulfobacterales bacterium]|nr:hypothetical protein [Desulfobacterales bacterium]